MNAKILQHEYGTPRIKLCRQRGHRAIDPVGNSVETACRREQFRLQAAFAIRDIGETRDRIERRRDAAESQQRG